MRVSVYIAASVDGFIAKDDGDVSWLDAYHQGSSEDYGFADFFASVDCLVMGRKTFEKVLSFGEWPYSEKQVIVLSSRDVPIPADLATCVRQMAGSPTEIIQNLQTEGLHHLYIDGGATIREFLSAQLVDELILTTVPILLGSGVPLFEKLPRTAFLQHISTQSFANGLVQTTYSIPSING